MESVNQVKIRVFLLLMNNVNIIYGKALTYSPNNSKYKVASSVNTHGENIPAEDQMPMTSSQSYKASTIVEL